MTPDDVYKLSSGVSIELAGDRSILIVDDIEEIYMCNNTLTEFLRVMDGKLSIAEIAHLLQANFESTGDNIARDLKKIVTELIKKGIVQSA